MGKKKLKRERSTEIPVNSFADIAFLLIIFFVIATKLVQNMGVITEIPSGEKSNAPDKTAITVQVHHDKITYNGTSMGVPELRKKLREKKLHKKTTKERVVLMETSGNVPYQLYFDVLSTVSSAGGIVAIVTEEEKKK